MATPKKVIKKKASPGQSVRKVVEPIAPGDSVEYSISVEVRGPHGTSWVKAGVISTVRAGETTAAAERRVTEYVESTVVQKADAIRRGAL